MQGPGGILEFYLSELFQALRLVETHEFQFGIDRLLQVLIGIDKVRPRRRHNPVCVFGVGLGHRLEGGVIAVLRLRLLLLLKHRLLLALDLVDRPKHVNGRIDRGFFQGRDGSGRCLPCLLR